MDKLTIINKKIDIMQESIDRLIKMFHDMQFVTYKEDITTK